MKHLYLNDDDSLTIPREVLDSLEWPRNAELAFAVDEQGNLVLSPTGMVGLNVELPDDVLAGLARKSIEEDVSVNELLTNLLTNAVKANESRPTVRVKPSYFITDALGLNIAQPGTEGVVIDDSRHHTRKVKFPKGTADVPSFYLEDV